MRKQTSDLRIPRPDALPLSHRDSMASKVYYEVHKYQEVHMNPIPSSLDIQVYTMARKLCCVLNLK